VAVVVDLVVAVEQVDLFQELIFQSLEETHTHLLLVQVEVDL
jgi:hypothetical protein